ncbi:MAG: iron ABC transporter substrate-binding protein [Phycisphaerae bacterium]|nr:iron ABC transporter substrate-binding protein [Phycisphaerae bacterium]
MYKYNILSKLVLTFLVAVVATEFNARAAKAEDDTLVLYCGRKKSLVGPIVRQFERETGIDVKVKYGSTSQLALALLEEGKRSSADIFWSQDAGALGALTAVGRFAVLPDRVLSTVHERYRNPEGRWVATSGRARVLAYSSKRVKVDALPESVFDLTDAKWRGRVGWAPTNASFRAFVTAMRNEHGDEKTLAWLLAMKRNKAQVYPKNTPIIQAIANGEIDLGLPNHYYLLRFKKADSKYPVEQAFFKAGDIGNLINVAGVGMLSTSRHKSAAAHFAEFLLSPSVQQYTTSEIFEYPVTEDVIVPEALPAASELNEKAPKVDLDAIADVEGTLKLLREAELL